MRSFITWIENHRNKIFYLGGLPAVISIVLLLLSDATNHGYLKSSLFFTRFFLFIHTDTCQEKLFFVYMTGIVVAILGLGANDMKKIRGSNP